eukprot:35363-Prymnesium_polylepis.1
MPKLTPWTDAALRGAATRLCGKRHFSTDLTHPGLWHVRGQVSWQREGCGRTKSTELCRDASVCNSPCGRYRDET